MAGNRVDRQRCITCGLLDEEAPAFLEAHHLEQWRCPVCERRDAETASVMSQKRLKHGLQLRWFRDEEKE